MQKDFQKTKEGVISGSIKLVIIFFTFHVKYRFTIDDLQQTLLRVEEKISSLRSTNLYKESVDKNALKLTRY